MSTQSPAIPVCGALLAFFLAAPTCGQERASPLEIKSIAEVESKVAQASTAGDAGRAGDSAPRSAAGRAPVELVPADKVVPGDRVIYTLEVRNGAETALDAPSFSYPIPE